MKVAARCLMPVWESNACVMLTPGGGPLPGGLYEIELNGILANMKYGSSFVFEMDRNPTLTDDGVQVVKDYSCKICGAPFKNMPSLGLHTRRMHREQPFIDGTENEEVVIPQDGRGRKKGRTFKCHECGLESPNLYRHRIHLKEHQNQPTPEVVSE